MMDNRRYYVKAMSKYDCAVLVKRNGILVNFTHLI